MEVKHHVQLVFFKQSGRLIICRFPSGGVPICRSTTFGINKNNVRAAAPVSLGLLFFVSVLLSLSLSLRSSASCFLFDFNCVSKIWFLQRIMSETNCCLLMNTLVLRSSYGFPQKLFISPNLCRHYRDLHDTLSHNSHFSGKFIGISL